ncbi:MAG: GNAT family N-acetyltransferase [Pseudomonadota bacterium]
MTEIVLRDLRPGDAGWIIQRHAELYAADEGFDASFEPLVARILADFLEDHDSTCERGWIAEGNQGRLGSIFCCKLDEDTAKLRLFLVEPAARGLGLGHRLLSACLEFATTCGYRQMTLWTHESHRAACALYAARGFTLIESKPVRNFGQDLVEQTWTIPLSPS